MIGHEREEMFHFFQGFDSPLLNITERLTIRNIKPELIEKNVSLFQYFVFCICKTLQEVENFNLRYDGNKIYKIQRLVPSYTVMRSNGIFNFCTFEFENNYKEFLAVSLKAKDIAEKSKSLIKDDLTHKDYVYMTCLPWTDFTSIQHPVGRFNDVTIPSIAFGKISVTNESLTFPISVQAHHGLVDGIHIAQFNTQLQQNLENIILSI